MRDTWLATRWCTQTAECSGRRPPDSAALVRSTSRCFRSTTRSALSSSVRGLTIRLRSLLQYISVRRLTLRIIVLPLWPGGSEIWLVSGLKCFQGRSERASLLSARVTQRLRSFEERSDPVWPVVSPEAGEKERPGRVRPGLASQKERSHSYNEDIFVCSVTVDSAH